MFGQEAVRLYLEDGTDVTMNTNPGVSLKRWIGVMGGQHSGDDTCVMRYTSANTYPAKNLPGGIFYATKEVSGYTLCEAPKGTGGNSDTRPNGLESRFGDASPAVYPGAPLILDARLLSASGEPILLEVKEGSWTAALSLKVSAPDGISKPSPRPAPR